MGSVNSRLRVLGGTHIWGGVNLMHFFMFFVFLVFFWGGNLGFWGGEFSPPRRCLEITLEMGKSLGRECNFEEVCFEAGAEYW